MQLSFFQIQLKIGIARDARVFFEISLKVDYIDNSPLGVFIPKPNCQIDEFAIEVCSE